MSMKSHTLSSSPCGCGWYSVIKLSLIRSSYACAKFGTLARTALTIVSRTEGYTLLYSVLLSVAEFCCSC